jgi:hypothetical protein
LSITHDHLGGFAALSSFSKVPAVLSEASKIGIDSTGDIPGEVFIMSTEGIGSSTEMGCEKLKLTSKINTSVCVHKVLTKINNAENK